jgi:hypothetical protein
MAKSTRKKMNDYRDRLRAAGLRPIQIWVPDARSYRIAEEARRQSLLVRRRKSERDALDFIEAIESAGDLDQTP